MRTGDEIIQELPWRWRVHGKIALLAGLGLLFDGWNVVLAGYVLPLLKADMLLSAAQLGLFGAAGLAGMAVGAFAWGTVADVIGRKRVFMLTVLVYGVASLACALSPNFEILLLARFIEGTGLGGCLPVDYSLVSEFTPRKVRGRVMALMGIAFPLGATLCGLISTLMLPLEDWRLMLGLMVIPAVLAVWIRRGIPESPLFLLRRNREAEARAVIDDLVRRTGAPVQEWRSPQLNDESRLSPMVFVSRLGDIWKFSWKNTMLIWGLFITVFFLYYGVLNWMPSILVGEGLGRYAAFLKTTLMTGAGVIGTLLSAWLVDVLGRKSGLLVGGLGSAGGIVMFALWLDVGRDAAVWLAVYGFSVQLLIATLYVYVPEIYPTLLRATGFGWASAISRIAASLAPILLGSVLWPVLGLVGAFGVTSAVVGLVLLLTLILGPETKGQGLTLHTEPAERTPEPGIRLP
ncbi:MFS transporter [Streptomyces sp. NPDC005727]|uniref:MFS transporter n=1 Tax=Streptomyces sp. NPDC005727 TaxID=3157053 RepID=UPI0033C28785